MYLEFFSLKRHPFRITPDPSLFYPGGVRGRGVVLDALEYCITTGEGILKVVGEVGSGKTMLCRMLEESLPDNVEIVYLANPNLSARDIACAIAFELRLEVDSATDRLLVMQKLQDYLLKRHREGGSVVVFIEEAQSMPLETLEEVRLLSNLETHRHKLIQIVMFRQPEMDLKLPQKSIRQLKERITHSFNLEPLTESEIREYLHFRLQTAGCPWPQLFSPQAEKLLAGASDGLTRRINILADKSLLAAYADTNTRPLRSSSGEIQPMVKARHVKTANADSEYKSAMGAGKWQACLGYAATLVFGVLHGEVDFLWLGRPGSALENAQGTVDRTEAAGSQAASQLAQRQPEPVRAEPTSTTVQRPSTAVQPASVAIQPPPALVSENSQALETAPVDEPRLTDIGIESVATARLNLVAEVQSRAGEIIDSGSPKLQAEPIELAANPVVSKSDIQPEPITKNAGNDFPSRIEPAKTPAAISAANEIAPAVVSRLEVTEQMPAAEPALVRAIAKPVAVPPARILPTVCGLASARLVVSEQWLTTLAAKSGYTIQMFAALTSEREKLQEYLEFIAPVGLIDNAFLCLISGNRSRPEQWLVLYSEFAGISDMRRFIDEVPPYLSQNSPYARNLNDVSCAN